MIWIWIYLFVVAIGSVIIAIILLKGRSEYKSVRKEFRVLLESIGKEKSQVTERINVNLKNCKLEPSVKKNNALIYGAGNRGQICLFELMTNGKQYRTNIIGWIDDNPELYNKEILGLRVLGGKDSLKKTVKELDIDEVIISINYPYAISKQGLQGITEACDSANVKWSYFRPKLESKLPR